MECAIWSVSREVSLSAFSVWFRLCGIYLLLVTRWAFNLVIIYFELYFCWLRWPIDCNVLLDCFVFFLLSFVEYELLAYFVCFAQAQFFKLVYNDMCNLEFFEKKCFRTFWGARWWDGGGVESAWSLLLSTSFQPLWLSYFLCILVLSTSHMIMMYHYHTVLFETVASHCIVSLCIVSHCIVWDCML